MSAYLLLHLAEVLRTGADGVGSALTQSPACFKVINQLGSFLFFHPFSLVTYISDNSNIVEFHHCPVVFLNCLYPYWFIS